MFNCYIIEENEDNWDTLQWRFQRLVLTFTNVASKINNGHHPSHTFFNSLISLQFNKI